MEATPFLLRIAIMSTVCGTALVTALPPPTIWSKKVTSVYFIIKQTKKKIIKHTRYGGQQGNPENQGNSVAW
jgi:hypothetical protein